MSEIITLASSGVLVGLLVSMLTWLLLRGRAREEALRESEENYRELFEFANEFITVTDLDGNVISVNRLMLETLGYSNEEMTGLNISEFMTPQSLATARQMTAKKLSGESRVTRYELDLRSREGSIIPAEFSTRLVYRDGKPVGIHAVGHDITERKTYERALSESEERYKSIFDNANDFIFTLDTSLRLTSATKYFCKMTGYDQGEIIGAHINKFLSAIDVEKAQKMVTLKLEGGYDVTRYELDLIGKDGHVTPIELHTSLAYRQGRLVGIQGIGRDITERRKYELALRESEEKYRGLFENAGDFAYGTDLNGNFNAVSEALLRATGYSREELLNASISKILTEENLKLARSMTAEKLAGGKRETRYEMSIVAKDGREIPIEVVSTLVYKGDRPVGVQGIGRDITERKRAEEALRRSESNYRELMEQAADAIFVADHDASRYVDVNRAACELLGYMRDELLQLGPRDLLDPEELVIEPAKFREIQDGETIHTERHLLRKDGSRVLVELSARMLADGRMMAVKRDITERKRAEEALQAASRAKSEFLANMSHEIRTPMNSVIGMAHLALRRETDPVQRSYLDKILLSGEHLLGIIDDILDFSKIDAGKLGIENVVTDVSRVMESVTSLVAEKARAKGLHLKIEVGEGIPAGLHGDPLRLRQVLLNFSDNAIKFTAAGEVVISVHKLGEDASGCLLHFEVRDTGIGMNRDELPGLFLSFQQADGSVTRNYGGTGLGLAISKRLVELMGGEIGVSSEPGKGSTFWCRVTLHKGKTAGAMPTDSSQSIQNDGRDSLHDKRVLLVENNLFNQQVAREFLENAGAIVVVANNGAEALDILSHGRFDGVLMDLQMPVMDGLEATRRIRAIPELATLPVIAMTANALEEERRRCLNAGMNDFITKPVRPELLYAVLARWIKQGEGQADTTVPSGFEPSGDATLIDFSGLEDMVGGRRDKMRELAYKFLALTKTDLNKLDSALEQHDAVQVRDIGHHIKSPAAMIGAAKFAGLCGTLEVVGDDLHGAHELADRMRSQLAQLEDRIKEEFR